MINLYSLIFLKNSLQKMPIILFVFFSEFQSNIDVHFISEPFQSILLTHCLRFIDFPSVESIGYQCVALMLNLVELHTENCGKNDNF